MTLGKWFGFAARCCAVVGAARGDEEPAADAGGPRGEGPRLVTLQDALDTLSRSRAKPIVCGAPDAAFTAVSVHGATTGTSWEAIAESVLLSSGLVMEDRGDHFLVVPRHRARPSVYLTWRESAMGRTHGAELVAKEFLATSGDAAVLRDALEPHVMLIGGEVVGSTGSAGFVVLDSVDNIAFLEELALRFRSEDEPALCPLSLCRPFVETVETAFEQVLQREGGAIPAIDPSLVSIEGEGDEATRRIKGINARFEAAHAEGTLLRGF